MFYEALNLPEQPSEMVFQYWWPECLSFSTGAGSTVENKVYLELFNALFV